MDSLGKQQWQFWNGAAVCNPQLAANPEGELDGVVRRSVAIISCLTASCHYLWMKFVVDTMDIFLLTICKPSDSIQNFGYEPHLFVVRVQPQILSR